MPKSAILMVLAGVSVVGSAPAQWADQHDPSIIVPPGMMVTEGRSNAALQYQMLWMILEPVLEFGEWTPEELDAMDQGVLPDRYAHQLNDHQEAIEELVAATKLERCDFGTQYEKGIGTLLPQLGVMRNSAKLLVNDARRHRSTDMDAAVERLAATIRLGEHATHGSLVIGSLVGVAITELARVEIVKLLEADELTAKQARMIIESLDRVLTDDPFHALEAIQTEKTMMIAWIKNEFQGEDAGQRLSVLLQFENNDDSDDLRRLSRMKGDQIAALTDETARAYDDLIAAWQAEDPPSELRKIEQKLEQRKYGLLTTLLLPALGRMHENTADSEQKLVQLRDELRAVQEE